MDFNNYRRYLIITLILITVLLLAKTVSGKEVGCVIQQIYTPDGKNLLEESKKFTVAPAYNKGGYQVISKTNIKDIGR